jgi:hypothetical protein
MLRVAEAVEVEAVVGKVVEEEALLTKPPLLLREASQGSLGPEVHQREAGV